MAWAARHKQMTGAGLPGRKSAFTFTASAWDLTVLPSGEVVPVLGVVTHEKGLDGVRSTGPSPDDVNEDGAILNATSVSGRIMIPREMVVLAFGEERKGYLGGDDGKMQPIQGTKGQHWLDAWTRVEFEHDQPVYRVDAAGYLDFHRRVLAFICPDGLSEAMIDKAQTRSPYPAGPAGKPFATEKPD